jgi:hypothetical protein
MSDSLVLLMNRANDLHIVDPDTVPHSDDLHPLLKIAAAIISAGYDGVAVDEIRLSTGRYIQSIDANLATPEGSILQSLEHIMDSGGVLPDPASVVAAIRQHYDQTAGSAAFAPGGRTE